MSTIANIFAADGQAAGHRLIIATRAIFLLRYYHTTPLSRGRYVLIIFAD